MFDAMNALLWVILATTVNSPVVKKESGTLKNSTFTSAELQIEQQQNPILNSDYAVAKQALDTAILERDETTIRLGLNKGSLRFKKIIILAIRNNYYQTFVPDLLTILENTQIAEIANENSVELNELKRDAVSALTHLTGLQFSGAEQLLPKDIELILKESQEWYRANEPQIQQELVAEMLERQKTPRILSLILRNRQKSEIGKMFDRWRGVSEIIRYGDEILPP